MAIIGSRWATALTIIAVIAIVAGLARLGFWQLDRALQKEQKQALIATREQTKIDLSTIPANSDWNSFTHMAVTAQGHYDASRQIIYDNITYQGQAGVYVLTPFKLAGLAVLVNRGWLAVPDRRKLSQLPIAVPEQTITIQGNLVKPVTRMLIAEAKTATTFPLLVQRTDLKAIAKKLGYPVLPLIVQLNAKDAHGYGRDWQPVKGSADKHRAYAIQWFGFAAIFLLGSLAVFWKQGIGRTNKP